jgi:hypothetical protein
MREEWSKRELSELGQGLLGFTAQQKLQIKTYIEATATRQSADQEDRSARR